MYKLARALPVFHLLFLSLSSLVYTSLPSSLLSHSAVLLLFIWSDELVTLIMHTHAQAL